MRIVPTRRGREVGFLFAVSLLCTAVLTILSHPAYRARAGVVGPALAVDLTLGLPLLGYVFLVRGRSGRVWLLAPLAAAGLLLAGRWIPEVRASALGGWRGLLLAAEVALLALAVGRAGRVIRAYRGERDSGRHGLDAMRSALTLALGDRLGGLLFTEGAAVACAVGFVSRRTLRPVGDDDFTVHRRGGYPAVLGVILLVVLVESAVAHVLLGLWSAKVAWLSTALGAYSGVWLVGDFQAARLRPTSARSEALLLNVGLRWSVRVPWSSIVRVHDERPEGDALRLTMLGPPDFWLELDEPIRVTGPFGSTRTARTLGIGVDEPLRLRDRIAAESGRPATSPS